VFEGAAGVRQRKEERAGAAGRRSRQGRREASAPEERERERERRPLPKTQGDREGWGSHAASNRR